MKYKIEITETLQKTIEIEANSEEEALSIIKAKYVNEQIRLEVCDYMDTEISIVY